MAAQAEPGVKPAERQAPVKAADAKSPAKTAEAKATIVTDFTPIPKSKSGELAAKWDIVLGVTPEDPEATRRGRGFGPTEG